MFNDSVDVDVILLNPIATVPSLTSSATSSGVCRPKGLTTLNWARVDMSSVIVCLSPQLPRAGITTFNVFVVFGV